MLALVQGLPTDAAVWAVAEQDRPDPADLPENVTPIRRAFDPEAAKSFAKKFGGRVHIG